MSLRRVSDASSTEATSGGETKSALDQEELPPGLGAPLDLLRKNARMQNLDAAIHLRALGYRDQVDADAYSDEARSVPAEPASPGRQRNESEQSSDESRAGTPSPSSQVQNTRVKRAGPDLAAMNETIRIHRESAPFRPPPGPSDASDEDEEMDSRVANSCLATSDHSSDDGTRSPTRAGGQSARGRLLVLPSGIVPLSGSAPSSAQRPVFSLPARAGSSRSAHGRPSGSLSPAQIRTTPTFLAPRPSPPAAHASKPELAVFYVIDEQAPKLIKVKTDTYVFGGQPPVVPLLSILNRIEMTLGRPLHDNTQMAYTTVPTGTATLAAFDTTLSSLATAGSIRSLSWDMNNFGDDLFFVPWTRDTLCLQFSLHEQELTPAELAQRAQTQSVHSDVLLDGSPVKATPTKNPTSFTPLPAPPSTNKRICVPKSMTARALSIGVELPAYFDTRCTGARDLRARMHWLSALLKDAPKSWQDSVVEVIASSSWWTSGRRAFILEGRLDLAQYKNFAPYLAGSDAPEPTINQYLSYSDHALLCRHSDLDCRYSIALNNFHSLRTRSSTGPCPTRPKTCSIRTDEADWDVFATQMEVVTKTHEAELAQRKTLKAIQSSEKLEQRRALLSASRKRSSKKRIVG